MKDRIALSNEFRISKMIDRTIDHRGEIYDVIVYQNKLSQRKKILDIKRLDFSWDSDLRNVAIKSWFSCHGFIEG